MSRILAAVVQGKRVTIRLFRARMVRPVSRTPSAVRRLTAWLESVGARIIWEAPVRRSQNVRRRPHASILRVADTSMQWLAVIVLAMVINSMV